MEEAVKGKMDLFAHFKVKEYLKRFVFEREGRFGDIDDLVDKVTDTDTDTDTDTNAGAGAATGEASESEAAAQGGSSRLGGTWTCREPLTWWALRKSTGGGWCTGI